MPQHIKVLNLSSFNYMISNWISQRQKKKRTLNIYIDCMTAGLL